MSFLCPCGEVSWPPHVARSAIGAHMKDGASACDGAAADAGVAPVLTVLDSRSTLVDAHRLAWPLVEGFVKNNERVAASKPRPELAGSFLLLCVVGAADPTGFEPAISGVTGRRVRPLHYGSMLRLRAAKRGYHDARAPVNHDCSVFGDSTQSAHELTYPVTSLRLENARQ